MSISVDRANWPDGRLPDRGPGNGGRLKFAWSATVVSLVRIWVETELALEFEFREGSRDILLLLSLGCKSCRAPWELTGGGILFLVAVPRAAAIPGVVKVLFDASWSRDGVDRKCLEGIAVDGDEEDRGCGKGSRDSEGAEGLGILLDLLPVAVAIAERLLS